MVFNSFNFAFFFIAVVAVYFAMPNRWRWLWLLLASSYFYTAFIPAYIFILFFLIGVDYICGLQIAKSIAQKRKRWLVVSILANIGVLFLFKYFNFFNSNVADLAHFFGWNYSLSVLRLALPIGLSFHVFQSLSYVIEVYRGNQAAERHLGRYALYVMFFPQLVAGPIERPQNLLHQFKENHFFDYNRVTSGLQLMLWGFFKKLVIADRLSLVVDHVYGNVQGSSGMVLAIATIAFAFQIFCDFSGYSDIARGSARVLGFRLMNNFNQPYFASSISDFWRRWHISLSSWFRDYVYIPLGGSRVSLARWCRNVMIVFILSGLWHGANWTFIVWGALHGSFIVLGKLTGGMRQKLASVFGSKPAVGFLSATGIIYTFLLVCFTWIFFRVQNLSQAWYIISHIATGWEQFFNLSYWNNFILTEQVLGAPKNLLLVCAASIGLMEFVHLLQRRQGSIRAWLDSQTIWRRWALYYGVTAWILLFGYFGKGVFIYFQF